MGAVTAARCCLPARAGLAVLLALLLAACGDARERQTPAPAPDVAQAPAAPSAVAADDARPDAGAETDLPGDDAETDRYRIRVRYPPEVQAPELLRAMHAEAATAKRELLASLVDADAFPELAERRLALLLDYRLVAQLPRFVSVRGSGMLDAGGAHPIPLESSFVLDRETRRLLQLADLFADPDAGLERVAASVRDHLVRDLLADMPAPRDADPGAREAWARDTREMIAAGTEPVAENYRHFAVLPGTAGQAAGVRVIFPPYQVGPYAIGTRTADVPAGELEPLLRPEYRAAFSP